MSVGVVTESSASSKSSIVGDCVSSGGVGLLLAVLLSQNHRLHRNRMLGASVTVMGASVSDGDGAVGCVVVTESSASSKSYVGGASVTVMARLCRMVMVLLAVLLSQNHRLRRRMLGARL